LKAPFAAAVFDMDGLLLDSERPIRDAWLSAAAELGAPLTEADYLSVVGRNEREGDECGRDALPQEDGGERHDEQRFERPQHDRQAGGDGRQSQQTQGIGESGVEEPEPAEARRRAGHGCAMPDEKQGQDDQTRCELDGEERERRKLPKGGLADDGADSPAGGGEDQPSEVATIDRHGTTPCQPRRRLIATALVGQAVENSIEPATSSGTDARSMTS